MTFLNPTYLWGFLALLVPLAIHLLNRGDVKTVKVGSIKFLTAQETKQARSIRLNELLLLLLRMLMLILLVLVLAEPKINTKIENRDIVYIIEPSLLQGNLLNDYLEELPKDVQLHLLSSGFPEFDKSNTQYRKQGQVPNYWQLSREMSQLSADSIVVFSESFISGIKGMRPSLKTNINWIVVNDGQSIDKWIAANELENDVKLIKLKSNYITTSFETKWLIRNDSNIEVNSDSLVVKSEQGNNVLPLSRLDSITIAIISDEEFLREAKYFEKAFRAISTFTRTLIMVNIDSDYSKIDKTNFEILVWFLEEKAPDINAKLIRFQTDSLASSILIRGSNKKEFILTERLDIENLFEGGLTQELLKILNLEEKLEPEIVWNDKRVMPSQEIQPILINNTKKNKLAQAEMIAISKWLWFILIVIVIAERVLAKLRKQ